MRASHQYRDYLHGYIRMGLLQPEVEALLMGQKAGRMRMRDLEAIFELSTGVDPRKLAPLTYRPRKEVS